MYTYVHDPSVHPNPAHVAHDLGLGLGLDNSSAVGAAAAVAANSLPPALPSGAPGGVASAAGAAFEVPAADGAATGGTNSSASNVVLCAGPWSTPCACPGSPSSLGPLRLAAQRASAAQLPDITARLYPELSSSRGDSAATSEPLPLLAPPPFGPPGRAALLPGPHPQPPLHQGAGAAALCTTAVAAARGRRSSTGRMAGDRPTPPSRVMAAYTTFARSLRTSFNQHSTTAQQAAAAARQDGGGGSGGFGAFGGPGPSMDGRGDGLDWLSSGERWTGGGALRLSVAGEAAGPAAVFGGTPAATRTGTRRHMMIPLVVGVGRVMEEGAEGTEGDSEQGTPVWVRPWGSASVCMAPRAGGMNGGDDEF